MESWSLRVEEGRALGALYDISNDALDDWHSVKAIAAQMKVAKSTHLYELLASMHKKGLIEFKTRLCPNGVSGFLYRLPQLS